MGRDNGYHKEDLRGDLIRAGLAYVEEHGHLTLSVRTLAQKVGVSPGAPYHHFPDRRALLLAIATEGFKDLIGRAVAIAESGRSGVEQLIELGLSFIDFTSRRPRIAELIDESELTRPRHDPQLREYQLIGQRVIREALESELPDASKMDIEIRGVAFWSAIYGFATLRRKNNVPSFEEFGMTEADVARSVVTQAATIATTA